MGVFRSIHNPYSSPRKYATLDSYFNLQHCSPTSCWHQNQTIPAIGYRPVNNFSYHTAYWCIEWCGNSITQLVRALLTKALSSGNNHCPSTQNTILAVLPNANTICTGQPAKTKTDKPVSTQPKAKLPTNSHWHGPNHYTP